MRRNDINKNILSELYNTELLSRREIALRLKCNITTVNKRMDKFGIVSRPRAKAVRISMQKQIIIALK